MNFTAKSYKVHHHNRLQREAQKQWKLLTLQEVGYLAAIHPEAGD